MKNFLLFTLVLLAACDARPEAPEAPPSEEAPAMPRPPEEPQPTPQKAPEGPTKAGLALETIDRQIEFESARASEVGGWLHHARVAELRLARARLSGRIDDYAAAGQALDTAFKAAQPGTGPFLARAAYRLAVHQNQDVEEDLDRYDQRVLKTPDEIAETLGLRAELAATRGDYERALALLLEAEQTNPTLQSAARLGTYHLGLRKYDEATRWYDQAVERAKADEQSRAWAMTQRATVDIAQQKLDAAAERLASADALFDGWPLIEELRADVLAAQGALEQAFALYASIAARTENGQTMAKAADVLEQLGRPKDAGGWRNRATEAFERDITRLETAVIGHAFDFFLATNPARALELARRDHERRPGPRSQGRLVQALIATGHREEARRFTQTRKAE